MLNDILKDLAAAYGDLADPSYAFAVQRLDAGMHEDVVRRLSEEFDLENQTSLGSDDVCISLFVRPREVAGPWKWCVQLSLVGNYAVVSRMGYAQVTWPITDAHDAHEVMLLKVLRGANLELLPDTVLREPTALRPPNSDTYEVYTIYNALFTDMDPFPGDASNEESK